VSSPAARDPPAAGKASVGARCEATVSEIVLLGGLAAPSHISRRIESARRPDQAKARAMQAGRARPLGMQVLRASTHLSSWVCTRLRTGMQVLGQHGSDWVGAAASAVARCSVVLVFSLLPAANTETRICLTLAADEPPAFDGCSGALLLSLPQRLRQASARGLSFRWRELRRAQWEYPPANSETSVHTSERQQRGLERLGVAHPASSRSLQRRCLAGRWCVKEI
jgi:hypothetical protein